MASNFTNDRLLEQVKLRASIPESQNSFSDAEILGIATDFLIGDICPWLISLREEFYLRNYDQAVTANQANYKITDRSLGNSLREVQILIGSSVKTLSRMDISEAKSTQAGTATAFLLSYDDITLYPTPASTDGSTIRQVYFIRPGNLVATSECAQIYSIDTVTKTLTFASTIPTTFLDTETYDLIKGKSGFEHLSLDQAVTGVTSTTMIFSSTLPDGLAVGDWVALAGQSPVPQCPQEVHSLLVQLTATTVLEALGQLDQSANSVNKAEAIRRSLATLLVNRVQGAPRRIKSSLL